MKSIFKYIDLLFIILFVFSFSFFATGGPFIAYSLNEAEERIKKPVASTAELLEIGGITHISGIAYDKATKDLIIVGQVNKGEPKITLDEFVVAMRAKLIHKKYPLVSIDRTSETEKTGNQVVRFEGGIANTKFGKDLLEADIILKKLGLGELRSNIFGLQSYFDMSAEYWEETDVDDSIHSRFWFVPGEETFVAVREGAGVITKLQIDVLTEKLSAIVNGKTITNLSNIRDETGEKFASALETRFDDVSTYYTQLKRLDPLFRCVGLAEAIERMYKYDTFKPKLDFWLHKYKIEHIETRNDYPILKRQELLQKGEKSITMTISGGIELRALILDLKDGNIKAFRDIVIKSNPGGNELTWRVPLEGWQSYEDHERKIVFKPAIDNNIKSLTVEKKFGTSFMKQFSHVDINNILIDKNVGGIYIDTDITDASFSNKNNSGITSDVIEKTRPNKNSTSWEFEYNE